MLKVSAASDMMLTGTAGTGAMAPRQSRLKKPRPLRSLSTQEESVDQDDVQADVARGRKLSLGSLEVDVSTVYAGDRGSPVCKEIAALSSRLLSFTDGQSDSKENYKCLSLQNSSSSNSSIEHHCASGHHDSSSPPPTAASSASADRHSHPSASAELPAALKTSCQDTQLLSKNINANSNCESFHMALDGYGCQPKCDLHDEGYGTISLNSPASGRGRFHVSTPVSAGTQRIITKDEDTNASYQSEPSWGSTKVMLLTSSGDELVLIGKNFKAILHASRILLKELDAKLLRIETVHDEETCKDQYAAAADVMSEVGVPDDTSDPCITGCFPQQKEWNTSWHYSKDELLMLSRSMLSHQPPSMWHVIANTHSDCCIPATKVRKYFEPSAFHCHDGSLIVDRCRN